MKNNVFQIFTLNFQIFSNILCMFDIFVKLFVFINFQFNFQESVLNILHFILQALK